MARFYQQTCLLIMEHSVKKALLRCFFLCVIYGSFSFTDKGNVAFHVSADDHIPDHVWEIEPERKGIAGISQADPAGVHGRPLRLCG